MNLCDINVIKPLLQKHGFHFSKSKGQNFLTQSWVPREIAEGAGIDETCGVLEVGPGIGPLTQALCENAGKVVSVEVDESLRPILAETMADQDNFTLIFGDILKTNIPALVEEHFQGLRPMACANLPYYITSPVLSALLEARCFEAVTVMVQKEVAQRICAQPGSKDYSAFSLFCQYYAEPEILFDVPPSCFIPQPKVTSAVITLRCRPEPPCPVSDEGLFFRVVKASFAQRRKTLTNGLSSGFGTLSKEQIISAIRAAGFSETVRGETLDIPGFARVAEEIGKLLSSK
ncbi:MAG: 16S rRNA (adenine(1518)-N(6)/adenine(1519)-N(6))-dimethyltransferase RsmA [Oscillospiraceae bacterium]|nr:16S rRNA (adenine(1518)-N(6)/adenine(1519)-N(6))-dimethyltransferase RsmA [Oscillospiraceae bacterium]